jgi:hypothetical protein
MPPTKKPAAEPTTAFDDALEDYDEQMDDREREATAYVHNLLDLCFASAQTLFGKAATPQDAFWVYDRVIEKMK